MVVKEDVYNWFKLSSSAQRVDAMCNLLHLCLPFELRFIGSCLEDLANQSYQRFRDLELKANDVDTYNSLVHNNSVTTNHNDSNILATLNVLVSLINSTNTRCANKVFEILLNISLRLRDHFSYDSGANDKCIAEDLMLLLTMSTLHPAFVFSQRVRLHEILTDLRNIVDVCKLLPDSENVKESLVQYKESTSQTEADFLYNELEQGEDLSTSVTLNHNNYIPCHSKVRVTDIRVINRNPDLKLEVIRSDKTKMTIKKTIQELRDFHSMLEGVVDRGSDSLPEWPLTRQPFLNVKSIRSVEEYFRQLLALMEHNSTLSSLVHELLSVDADQTYSNKHTEHVPTGSTDSDNICVRNNDESDLPINTPNEVSKEKKSYSDLFVSISSDSKSNQPDRIHRRNEVTSRWDDASLCIETTTGSSRASPDLSVYTSNESTLSENLSLTDWLKKWRLHKYADRLSGYSIQQLKNLTKEELRKLDMTSGACDRFMVAIQHLGLQEAEVSWPRIGSPSIKHTSRLLNSSGRVKTSSPGLSRGFEGTHGPSRGFEGATTLSSPGSLDSSCSEYSTPPDSPQGLRGHKEGGQGGRRSARILGGMGRSPARNESVRLHDDASNSPMLGISQARLSPLMPLGETAPLGQKESQNSPQRRERLKPNEATNQRRKKRAEDEKSGVPPVVGRSVSLESRAPPHGNEGEELGRVQESLSMDSFKNRPDTSRLNKVSRSPPAYITTASVTLAPLTAAEPIVSSHYSGVLSDGGSRSSSSSSGSGRVGAEKARVTPYYEENELGDDMMSDNLIQNTASMSLSNENMIGRHPTLHPNPALAPIPPGLAPPMQFMPDVSPTGSHMSMASLPQYVLPQAASNPMFVYHMPPHYPAPLLTKAPGDSTNPAPRDGYQDGATWPKYPGFSAPASSDQPWMPDMYTHAVALPFPNYMYPIGQGLMGAVPQQLFLPFNLALPPGPNPHLAMGGQILPPTQPPPGGFPPQVIPHTCAAMPSLSHTSSLDEGEDVKPILPPYRCPKCGFGFPQQLVFNPPFPQTLTTSNLISPQQQQFIHVANPQGPYRPTNPLNIPNGVHEVRYQSSATNLGSANHINRLPPPLLTLPPNVMFRPPLPPMSMPPPVMVMCSNCGSSNHDHLNCTESLPEQPQNSGHFHLNLTGKSTADVV